MGTIHAVHEISIGSKLLARVVEVNLKAGQKVQRGEVLLRLDDADLRAKLQQAKAAVASIEANRAQAANDAQPGRRTGDDESHQPAGLRKGRGELRVAQGRLAPRQETVNEVQATSDWATIRSPITGTVIDKKVDVGDMVTPGQILAHPLRSHAHGVGGQRAGVLARPAPGRPGHRREN